MAKITTSSNLKEFLKIIVEESVHSARKKSTSSAESERMFQTDLAGSLGKLKKSGKKDTDVHDEADDDLLGDEEDGDKKKARKKEKLEVEPEEKENPKKSSRPAEEITFTMIKDRVNTIRSGRSLRDQEIRGELKTYFGELSDDEQSALYAFLDGIAQVLTAGIDGSEADEPSDEPYNVKMSSDAKSRNSKKSDDSSQKKKKKVSQSPQSSGSSSGVENTAPPIDVGRKQRTEALRRRLKELM